MALVIPVFPGEPLYKQRVRLEGRDFIFRFDWANREQRYYMTIANQDGVRLLSGVKVIANWGFLTRNRFDPRLPPGELIAVDLEQGGEPPLMNEFGNRVRLFYYESTEDIGEFAT